ncbi:phospho-sugar mutase [Oscillospiraceae bacterium LCP25S3_E10]|nr:phospho-sugar mutase [Ruminococcus sp.]MDY2855780.1 phospho-sugar mutase [Oscillospiraceae bacterium]
MNTNQLYDLWLKNATEDPDLIPELESIKDDQDAIYDRFYRELEFGTAGLRGVLGAGTNRMNIYVVRYATQGLANYLKKNYDKASVAIAGDSRIKSDVFVKEAARVLAANGIKAYVARELQPTPVVSFCVRELKCQAGIMVTASHNPAKYNGYKCYGSDGCQMTDESADAVYSEIQSIDIFNDVKTIEFEQGLADGSIEYIEDTVYDSYIENVKKQAVNPGICKGAGLKVVYTPLNGAGNKLVRRVLAETGVDNVVVVKEQEMPDGNFTTCPYPNPEIKEALQLGLDLCEKEKPDLLLATDPDSDRVGIAVKLKDGSFRLMTGNETGIMLTNYILSCRKALNNLPQNPFVVKTIVTTELVAKICEKFGCELRNVLTGFKYIGEQILELEKAGEEERYIFGFEESYGYLAGTYVRDKDAVVASMLICEMAAYYRTKGKSLDDVITELYKEFGYYKNKTVSFEFDGAAGLEKMGDIMTSLRENHPDEICGRKVTVVNDYKLSLKTDKANGTTAEIKLPKSNVIAFMLDDGCSITVRPSGTEPKIKLYITAVGENEESATKIADQLVEAGEKLMGI